MAAPLDATDDLALVEAWRAGDRRAGERLFERYFDAVYRFFRTKTHGDPSDLVQRTFLGCLEARERFRGASTFRTFLYAIARNELYAHYRRARGGAALDFGVSSVADLGDSPSALVRRQADRETLLAALQTLPVDLQVALELRFWEDLTGPDLAFALGIPEGTVRSRLRRGLEALREALVACEAGPGLLAGSVGDADADLEGWASRLRAALGDPDPSR